MSPFRPLVLALLALACAAPAGLGAQDDGFLDADARVLHAAARDRWLAVDRSLIRYQAVLSQRIGVGLRMPLRDRSLLNHEAAARVIWERGGEGERGGVRAIQMLAMRSRLPQLDEEDGEPRNRRCSGSECLASAGIDGIFLRGFRPGGDPLLLGLDEWSDGDRDRFQHPFADSATLHYRFRTGDTLTVTLPDGRTLRTVELAVQPRRDDPFLLSGALWIEPATGAVVRAAYRLARPLDVEEDDADGEDDDIPALLRPFVIDVTLVTVDFALWDFRIWMPRSLRIEGTVRAGILRAPVAAEIAYEIEDVVTADDTAASAPLGSEGAVARLAAAAAAAGGEWRVQGRALRRGPRVSYLVPADETALQRSAYLPEPIWRDDAAFASPQEIRELADALAQLPPPQRVTTVANFDWGTERPDLVRYNRVEGLSLGARGSLRFGLGGAPLSAALTARIGSADLEPRGSLSLTHETLARSLSVSAYRDLQLTEPSTRALGVGGSAMALLFGRDDGDYYQATGVGVAATPPLAERAWYRARAYVERQDPTPRETNESVARWLGADPGFRPGAPAARADQAGIELAVAPWWGRDPTRPAAGVELALLAERGDFDFARARLGARASLPLLWGARLAVSAAGGTTRGSAPPQRLWMLGGPASLRGFAPGVRIGPSFLSGRAELALPLTRVAAARAVALALFADGGWAGSRTRIRWDAAAASAGVGLSILDGILRLDAAWGWHGPEGRRLDLYLDGLL